ncbi:hypothetical protein PRK78_001576 [Emydomyces testavorans]|uniref:GED domain-containing protein n=1 Tax=Emydomyces testavorans TaxID=2070801 RepID=A0AAF0IH01_9EURO|nr:hypothetical protein PRK78_001576 [Emydomyces testavorans]
MADIEPVPLNLLQAEGPAELLSRIDELRNLGFHHRICLPQIVVCGRRGCGKTSVFRAITGIALPVNHDIRTRFTIEVAFRRSAEVSTCVKIRPGPNASSAYKNKLQSFARSQNWLEDIPQLLAEAELLMGLNEERQYSEDVLQLNVSGPSLPDLTAIDLPGLLQESDDNQTPENVSLVRELTESYVNNPRSIVLAVLSADTPLFQHAVLQLTAPCASRTMAIVTKLDTLSPDSDNLGTFYARVKYQDTPLKLGWHVLKNTDTRHKDSFGLSRDDTESLFFSSSTPWKTLSPNAIGIDSLRDRLNKVLLGQVELQLSVLSSEIQKELEAHRTSLQKLGPEMSTIAERRLHITKIGEMFQRLTREAVVGEYYDPYFRYHSNLSVRRLRSVIRKWAEDFATDMRQRGHSHRIYDDAAADIVPAPGFPDDPQPMPKSEYVNGILELLKSSTVRGLPGLANAQIVGELFIRHSSKWGKIAKAHVSELWKKVKQFLDDLLHHTAGIGSSEAIMRKLINTGMEERLRKTNAKVDELLTPYTKVMPLTLNQQLSSRIRHIRRKSSEKSRLATPSDNVDLSLCNEILDCMQAYYSVSLGVFLDNVAALAVENCLLDGLEDLMSPGRISQMTDSDIEHLATDSKEVRSARAATARKVKVFEVAAAACTRCQMAALESSPHNYTTLSDDSTVNSSSADSNFSSRESSTSSEVESPTVNRSLSKIATHKRTNSSHASRAFPLHVRTQEASSPMTGNNPPLSAGSKSSSLRRSSSFESERQFIPRSPFLSPKPVNQSSMLTVQATPAHLSTPEALYPGGTTTSRIYAHGRAISADKLVPATRETSSQVALPLEAPRHGHTLSADRIMPPLPETTVLNPQHTRTLLAEKITSLPAPPPRSPARMLSLSILTGSRNSGHPLRRRISKLKPGTMVEEKYLPCISLPFNVQHHGSMPIPTDSVQPV